MEKQGSKIGAAAAIIGAGLLFAGTFLHPMDADPSIPLAAFTEYAADHHWVATHLMQLFGVIFIVAALMLLSRRMADGKAAEWATLGMTGAIASLAVASALQAIDGVALKVMVDRWAATPEPGKSELFQAAFAVRQVETGLASITSLLLGLTASVYGVALWIDRSVPRWIAALGIVGGVPTVIAGVVIAHTGFSHLAMVINMPSTSLLILWMMVLGIYAWRQPVF